MEVTRRVLNSITGEKKEIKGEETETFHDACVQIAPMDVSWSVLDRNGNDISNKKLKDYNDIAQIAPKDIEGGK